MIHSSEFNTGAKSVPDWAGEVIGDFRTSLSHKDFPCLFAQKSLKDNDQFFQFLDSDCRQYDLAALRNGLIEYVKLVRQSTIRQCLIMPLIVFVKPVEEDMSLSDYHGLAWSILQFLHNHDPSPWPDDIPLDPEHFLWSFCFNGEQLFVNFSCPKHTIHRSRSLCQSLCLVINPRKNFDEVADISAQGQLIRKTIRERVERYDGLPASDDLGTYGDPSNREWLQYQMIEDGTDRLDQCPLRLSNENPLNRMRQQARAHRSKLRKDGWFDQTRRIL